MPKALPLVINPDERLRKRSTEIDSKEIQNLEELWRDMIITMMENDGVGLAAPQIGENIRLIVVNTAEGAQAMFNPVIVKKSLLKEWGEEGCLSIPKVFGDVKRHKKLRVTFFDEQGNERTIDTEGLMARVIQHEVDHIDGVLFIDKAKNIHTIQ